MILYLLRHAIAQDSVDWTGSDADRPLTLDGAKKMKEVAQGMRKADIKFDLILTSPWKRAVQTAEIVAKVFDTQDKLKVSKALAGDGNPEKLIQQLHSEMKSWGTVLLVGHEPYLSKLVSLWIGGKNLQLDLKKGGLVKLSAETLSYGPCAILEWWVPPKIFKKF